MRGNVGCPHCAGSGLRHLPTGETETCLLEMRATLQVNIEPGDPMNNFLTEMKKAAEVYKVKEEPKSAEPTQEAEEYLMGHEKNPFSSNGPPNAFERSIDKVIGTKGWHSTIPPQAVEDQATRAPRATKALGDGGAYEALVDAALRYAMQQHLMGETFRGDFWRELTRLTRAASSIPAPSEVTHD